MSRLKLYIFSFFEDLKTSLVDLSVIIGIVIDVIRIIADHPIHWHITAGYVLLIAVTAFAPEEVVKLIKESCQTWLRSAE